MCGGGGGGRVMSLLQPDPLSNNYMFPAENKAPVATTFTKSTDFQERNRLSLHCQVLLLKLPCNSGWLFNFSHPPQKKVEKALILA